MPFEFQSLAIPDIIEVRPRLFSDERGIFTELYKASAFREAGIDATFVQINHSSSKRGVVRGLHYQLQPRVQGKLVGVSHGEIFDVAVDIRNGSPTFGKWVGRTLTADERVMMYVPPGFAHGFAALSDDAHVVYYTTDEYSPEHERGILWNDPAIGIDWPVTEPILSDKDKEYPVLKDAEYNFEYTG